MGSDDLHPETFEEKIVYRVITSTWLIWLIGGLYLASPILGWSLLGLAIARQVRHESNLLTGALLSPTGLAWTCAMLFMLLALVVGHADYSFPPEQILKSIVGWAKGWALFAVFILCGAALKIRPSVVMRASNVLAIQTLVLAPIFVLAAFVNAPEALYVSPLAMLGGPGPEFFDVTLYSRDPVTGQPRWRFFAPWAPAAGMIAVLGFFLAAFDRSLKWKSAGIAAALAICALSQSRLALVGLIATGAATFVLINLTRPAAYYLMAAMVLLIGLNSEIIMTTIADFQDQFTRARADSSRVRSTLQNIAQHRWLAEAPIWGHGAVERGPHLVEYMPMALRLSHCRWSSQRSNSSPKLNAIAWLRRPSRCSW
jgi:hypothetical protein